MYICHCRGVSDRVIAAEISEGAASVDELSRRCGAGAGCGGCWPALAGLLTEQRRPVRPGDEFNWLVEVG